MNKKFICIVCPVGCEIEVEYNEKIKKINGNSCENGAKYVIEEIYDPKRVLTAIMKVKNGEIPFVSVKTSKPIPKDLMFKSMQILSKMSIPAPIKIGDVIIENFLGTGVNIVCTKNIYKNKFNKNKKIKHNF